MKIAAALIFGLFVLFIFSTRPPAPSETGIVCTTDGRALRWTAGNYVQQRDPAHDRECRR